MLVVVSQRDDDKLLHPDSAQTHTAMKLGMKRGDGKQSSMACSTNVDPMRRSRHNERRMNSGGGATTENGLLLNVSRDRVLDCACTSFPLSSLLISAFNDTLNSTSAMHTSLAILLTLKEGLCWGRCVGGGCAAGRRNPSSRRQLLSETERCVQKTLCLLLEIKQF